MKTGVFYNEFVLYFYYLGIMSKRKRVDSINLQEGYGKGIK